MPHTLRASCTVDVDRAQRHLHRVGGINHKDQAAEHGDEPVGQQPVDDHGDGKALENQRCGLQDMQRNEGVGTEKIPDGVRKGDQRADPLLGERTTCVGDVEDAEFRK